MKLAMFTFALALMNFASPAWSAQTVAPTDPFMMSMKPNFEDRDKMATAHEQMAACLRSELDFSLCHDALHQECQELLGDSCPGMESRSGKGSHKGMKNKK